MPVQLCCLCSFVASNPCCLPVSHAHPHSHRVFHRHPNPWASPTCETHTALLIDIRARTRACKQKTFQVTDHGNTLARDKEAAVGGRDVRAGRSCVLLGRRAHCMHDTRGDGSHPSLVMIICNLPSTHWQCMHSRRWCSACAWILPGHACFLACSIMHRR